MWVHTLLTLVFRCKCRAFCNGGLVLRMDKCKCWAFPIIGWMDVSAEPFRHEGLVPSMVEYKCWAFLTLVVRCKCRSFWHGGLVPRMAKCKCWAIPIIGWMDVSVGPFWQDCGLCYHMVNVSAGHFLSDMIIGLVPTWSDISVGWAILT